QLAAEVIEEFLLALLCQVTTNSVQACPLAAVGESRARDDRPTAKVMITPFADGAVPLEHQADRVKSLMAARTALVNVVARQKLPQWQIAQHGFVLGELRDFRRWRRYVLAQDPANDPVASLYRTGAQARRICGKEDGHRQQATAAILVGTIDPD